MTSSRTDAQTLASRTNGALSHGPATPEGKARSSRNATVHGLWSRDVVLATEDPQEFAELEQRLLTRFIAATPERRELIQEFAAASWRLNRVLCLETTLMDEEIERQRQLEENADAEPKLLTALAWRALYQNGTLRHLHRHETRLRRLADRLEAELLAALPHLLPIAAPVAPPVRAVAVPTPPVRIEPAPVARPDAPKPAKRPTYDSNGRRIRYDDAEIALAA